MAVVFADTPRFLATAPVLNKSIQEMMRFIYRLAPDDTFVFAYDSDAFYKTMADQNGGKEIFPAIGIRMDMIEPRDDYLPLKRTFMDGISVRRMDVGGYEFLHPIPVKVSFTGKFVALTNAHFISFAQSYIFAKMENSCSFKMEMKAATPNPPFSISCKVELESPGINIPIMPDPSAEGGRRGETEFSLTLKTWMGKVSNKPALDQLNIVYDTNYMTQD